MKRQMNPTSSALGKEVTLRFARTHWKTLRTEFAKDTTNEQFAFGLFSRARTADGTVLIVHELFFPDRNDLSSQSAGGVAPTADFQGAVYMVAEQRGLEILDIHTHPFSRLPRFSSIDEAESTKNAACICKRFAPPTTLALVVFNSDCTAHDAVIFDRSIAAFRQISTVEVLGRRMQSMRTGEGPDSLKKADGQYSRPMLIPGWDQQTLGRLKVALIGLGGNGAEILRTLVSMGVGTEGWIAGIDADLIEESNLPRICYAYPEHVGQPKATVAAQYVGRKNPKVRFYSYPCWSTEKAVKKRLRGASVIFCAPDGDGARKDANDESVRYMIPMIDLGCDIQLDGEKISAGGQVRIVLPGSNACLVCCGGYDPSVAALELMDDTRAAMHGAHGYVRGHRANPTPSIANLNATVSQLSIAALLALVHGTRFGDWDYAHFDQLTGQTMTAKTHPSKDCPLCGPNGILGAADEIPEAHGQVPEPTWTKKQPEDKECAV